MHEIPRESNATDFAIDHEHYNHADADSDVNCMLPIERLAELAAAGEIGEVAPRHVGLMGCISDPAELQERTAPELAELFVRDGVDLVLPGGTTVRDVGFTLVLESDDRWLINVIEVVKITQAE